MGERLEPGAEARGGAAYALGHRTDDAVLTGEQRDDAVCLCQLVRAQHDGFVAVQGHAGIVPRAPDNGPRPAATRSGRQAAGTSGGSASGSRTSKVVPLPSSLVTVMLPPWASTIVLVIESPSPTPGIASVEHRAAAEELVEDLALLGLGDAATGVADPDHGDVAVASDAALDATAGGVYLIALLNRLSKTCASRSLSPLMSSLAPPLAVSRSSSSPAAVAALRASTAERSQQLGHGDAFDVEHRGDRLQRRREQVVDQAVQPPGVALYDEQVGARVLREVLGVVEDDVDVADDRGQRRAQLVADRGDELVLDPRGHDQLGDVVVGQHRAAEVAVVAEVRRRRDRQRPSLGRHLARPRSGSRGTPRPAPPSSSASLALVSRVTPSAAYTKPVLAGHAAGARPGRPVAMNSSWRGFVES